MSVCRALALACLALVGFVSSGAGAVISRDWKTPGDGLLTYDDVNQREWLDISASMLDQFGSRVDEAVATAKLELMPGGVFEGFTLAGREDIDQLVASSGFDGSSYSNSLTTVDQMRHLILLVGGPDKLVEPAGTAALLGVIDETVPTQLPSQPTRVAVLFAVYDRAPARPNGQGSYGYNNQSNDLYRSSSVSTVGLMLYRSAIPEPSASLLFSFCFGLSCFRRNSCLATVSSN